MRYFRPLSFLLLLPVILGCGGSSVKKDSKNATKNPIVQIETTQGVFKAELYGDVKVTVQNFTDLVNRGFYNGLTFHRYEPGFVIQGGDPAGTGSGSSEKTIPLEIVEKYTHVEGALGMARSSNPDSASCQFYVCLAPSHFLDKNYAVFGKVVEGFENVQKLRKGDKMTKVFMVEPVAPK